MYSEAERLNRVEHLLKEQAKTNMELKAVLIQLTCALSVELGAVAAKDLIDKIERI